MATLRDIQRQIAAVKKTEQITRAMNMVAAARLRIAQQRIEGFRPYAEKYAEVIANLASKIEPDIHPFLIQPEEVKTIGLAAFSSDRGLCGSFNTNVISGVEKTVAEWRRRDAATKLTLVGRKAHDYFRRRSFEVHKSYTNVMNAYEYSDAIAISQQLSDAFLLGEVDEVWIFYTRFFSVSQLVPTLVKLLPISPPEEEEAQEGPEAGEYLCEPSADAIMIDLLPRSFTIQIYNAMLETSASEFAARMVAMDNATKNCEDMVTDLTMAYNKARQSAITMELLDIIGGAEALKA